MPLSSRTPRKDDSHVLKLLGLLNTAYEPVYLDIKAVPLAVDKDCINIVNRKISQSGGRTVLGWQLWKQPFLIEAEFHAVWETPTGELEDITPKPVSDKQILFVRDDRLVYEGKQIDNMRLNITSNKLVDDFIAVAEAKYQFENEGDLAFFHGNLADVLSPQKLHRLKIIYGLFGCIDMLLNNGGTRRSVCLCGSGRKFEDCHGYNLEKTLEALTQ